MVGLGWVDRLRGLIIRLDKTFKQLDMFFQQVIDDHMNPTKPPTDQKDIINMLLQVMDARSSSFDLTLDHVKALICSCEEDVERIPYLKVVVKETLRLFPPAPLLLPKESMDRCNIQGYEIQPKTLLLVNAWAIGRDPKTWEDPEEFYPERFLNSSIEFKGQDFEMIPFGARSRICPGMNIAVVASMELALVNLVHSFDWELPDGIEEQDIDTEVTPRIAVHKKNDLCLVIKNP